MKAAVWYGKKDLRVEEIELKQTKDTDVKVRVAWAGICGSDLHEYEEGPVFVPNEKEDPLTGEIAPLTMGHEFAGVIEEVGPKVTKYKVGDRVVINPTITYGNKSEDLDPYDGFSFIGLHGDGGFTKYANVPEDNVYLLPESLTLQDGALVEPTAVAVQAVKEGKLQFGDTVAVFGAGPIGLVTIIAAKAAGASKIIALDLSETRIEKAKELGATHVVNSSEQDAVTAIKEIVPDGVDVSFEVAGVAPTFKQAIDATRARGTMVIVSIFAREIEWNPIQLTNTGVKVTSTIAYTPTTFQQTVDLMGTGQLKPQGIITDQIQLDDIVENGFEALTNDKSQAKILVELSGEK
ncbi:MULTISPECIES: 2,3-butanediol dehydrogenase [Bacillales]|uniref:(R,R)-butanediol dehydrogenase / meso-butanediol dehydrogenase / diacetyl reductase n=4 Tax=Bacillales TaxID=1385 RepID=A0A1I4Q3R6_9BACI|nr:MULTISPECIES: 2,3-butanediol dehydrogenase [Bacillaceae]MRI67007.1 zinc-binding dehydrogenase [Gracilibacillus thailandensis]SFM34677.1 (R,R)-butanediol dehydrogenase / meso-butanediol dehydrogenase / diacetyl reductase [Salibacterium qingdaonense]SIS92510.1 (R,R)-butanediol dehydrogenase / meso-butanediol dehydrogenase / diacetyl reductase [Salimicrobium salexigens]